MRKRSRKNFKKDTVNIRWVVNNVLLYTLPRCGFPETKLPPTDYDENGYNLSNFIETAGLCTLWLSLRLRDEWREILELQPKTAFCVKDILSVIEQRNIRQSMLQVFLAFCNEVIMFCYSKGIINDISSTIAAISNNIRRFPGFKKKFIKKFEEFDKDDNLVLHSRWIPNFITQFAIPYGSRKDVSKLFTECTKQCEDFLGNDPDRINKRLTALNDRLGFVPHELILAIQRRGSPDLPEILLLVSTL